MHFSDAISAVEANDNLYKIRKLCNMYKEVFKNNYCPRRELSVDESLELWKSERFRLRVSIAKKKNKEGIEMFLICEASTGYCLDFEYLSKNPEEEWDKIDIEGYDTSELLRPARTVLHLAKPYLNKGHTIGIDNYYSDPMLFEIFLKNKTDAVGTIKPNKIFLPKGF